MIIPYMNQNESAYFNAFYSSLSFKEYYKINNYVYYYGFSIANKELIPCIRINGYSAFIIYNEELE